MKIGEIKYTTTKQKDIITFKMYHFRFVFKC